MQPGRRTFLKAAAAAGIAAAAPPTRAVSHKWADDPFAGGAYTVWSPGEVAAQRTALRLPAGPVRFAGVHTALDAPGMEGAVRSGERAADEIITGEQT